MKNLNKKDLLLSLIIGEVAAWLMLFIGKNLASENPALEGIVGYLWYLPIVFPILCAGSIIIAHFLAGKIKIIYQFAKFVLVGGLNFLIDMGVLNILIFTTGISAGLLQTVFKGASFFVAVVNSYFWNKHWTFERKTTESVAKEFTQFLVISVIGFFINIGIDYVLVNLVTPFGGMPEKTWAQFSAMLAAAIALFWNFAGYKFIVFDTKKPQEEPKPAYDPNISVRQ